MKNLQIANSATQLRTFPLEKPRVLPKKRRPRWKERKQWVGAREREGERERERESERERQTDRHTDEQAWVLSGINNEL